MMSKRSRAFFCYGGRLVVDFGAHSGDFGALCVDFGVLFGVFGRPRETVGHEDAHLEKQGCLFR